MSASLKSFISGVRGGSRKKEDSKSSRNLPDDLAVQLRSSTEILEILKAKIIELIRNDGESRQRILSNIFEDNIDDSVSVDEFVHNVTALAFEVRADELTNLHSQLNGISIDQILILRVLDTAAEIVLEREGKSRQKAVTFDKKLMRLLTQSVTSSLVATDKQPAAVDSGSESQGEEVNDDLERLTSELLDMFTERIRSMGGFDSDAVKAIIDVDLEAGTGESDELGLDQLMDMIEGLELELVGTERIRLLEQFTDRKTAAAADSGGAEAEVDYELHITRNRLKEVVVSNESQMRSRKKGKSKYTNKVSVAKAITLIIKAVLDTGAPATVAASSSTSNQKAATKLVKGGKPAESNIATSEPPGNVTTTTAATTVTTTAASATPTVVVDRSLVDLMDIMRGSLLEVIRKSSGNREKISQFFSSDNIEGNISVDEFISAISVLGQGIQREEGSKLYNALNSVNIDQIRILRVLHNEIEKVWNREGKSRPNGVPFDLKLMNLLTHSTVINSGKAKEGQAPGNVEDEVEERLGSELLDMFTDRIRSMGGFDSEAVKAIIDVDVEAGTGESDELGLDQLMDMIEGLGLELVGTERIRLLEQFSDRKTAAGSGGAEADYELHITRNRLKEVVVSNESQMRSRKNGKSKYTNKVSVAKAITLIIKAVLDTGAPATVAAASSTSNQKAATKLVKGGKPAESNIATSEPPGNVTTTTAATTVITTAASATPTVVVDRTLVDLMKGSLLEVIRKSSGNREKISQFFSSDNIEGTVTVDEFVSAISVLGQGIQREEGSKLYNALNSVSIDQIRILRVLDNEIEKVWNREGKSRPNGVPFDLKLMNLFTHSTVINSGKAKEGQAPGNVEDEVEERLGSELLDMFTDRVRSMGGFDSDAVKAIIDVDVEAGTGESDELGLDQLMDMIEGLELELVGTERIRLLEQFSDRKTAAAAGSGGAEAEVDYELHITRNRLKEVVVSNESQMRSRKKGKSKYTNKVSVAKAITLIIKAVAIIPAPEVISLPATATNTIPSKPLPQLMSVLQENLSRRFPDKTEGRKQFLKTFRDLDQDNTYKVDSSEFSRILRSIESTLSPSDMDQLFAYCCDSNGEIEYEPWINSLGFERSVAELAKIVASTIQSLLKEIPNSRMKISQFFSSDNIEGSVSVDEFISAISVLGQGIQREEGSKLYNALNSVSIDQIRILRVLDNEIEKVWNREGKSRPSGVPFEPRLIRLLIGGIVDLLVDPSSTRTMNAEEEVIDEIKEERLTSELLDLFTDRIRSMGGVDSDAVKAIFAGNGRNLEVSPEALLDFVHSLELELVGTERIRLLEQFSDRKIAEADSGGAEAEVDYELHITRNRLKEVVVSNESQMRSRKKGKSKYTNKMSVAKAITLIINSLLTELLPVKTDLTRTLADTSKSVENKRRKMMVNNRRRLRLRAQGGVGVAMIPPETAATLIQSSWRGRKCRKQLRKLHRAATEIQKIIRGKAVKRHFQLHLQRVKELKQSEMERLKRLRDIRKKESELLLLKRMPVESYLDFFRIQRESSARVLQRVWHRYRIKKHSDTEKQGGRAKRVETHGGWGDAVRNLNKAVAAAEQEKQKKKKQEVDYRNSLLLRVNTKLDFARDRNVDFTVPEYEQDALTLARLMRQVKDTANRKFRENDRQLRKAVAIDALNVTLTGGMVGEANIGVGLGIGGFNSSKGIANQDVPATAAGGGGGGGVMMSKYQKLFEIQSKREELYNDYLDNKELSETRKLRRGQAMNRCKAIQALLDAPLSLDHAKLLIQSANPAITAATATASQNSSNSDISGNNRSGGGTGSGGEGENSKKKFEEVVTHHRIWQESLGGSQPTDISKWTVIPRTGIEEAIDAHLRTDKVLRDKSRWSIVTAPNDIAGPPIDIVSLEDPSSDERVLLRGSVSSRSRRASPVRNNRIDGRKELLQEDTEISLLRSLWWVAYCAQESRVSLPPVDDPGSNKSTNKNAHTDHLSTLSNMKQDIVTSIQTVKSMLGEVTAKDLLERLMKLDILGKKKRQYNYEQRVVKDREKVNRHAWQYEREVIRMRAKALEELNRKTWSWEEEQQRQLAAKKLQAVARGKAARDKTKVLQAEYRVMMALRQLVKELGRPELQGNRSSSSNNIGNGIGIRRGGGDASSALLQMDSALLRVLREGDQWTGRHGEAQLAPASTSSRPPLAADSTSTGYHPKVPPLSISVMTPTGDTSVTGGGMWSGSRRGSVLAKGVSFQTPASGLDSERTDYSSKSRNESVDLNVSAATGLRGLDGGSSVIHPSGSVFLTPAGSARSASGNAGTVSSPFTPYIDTSMHSEFAGSGYISPPSSSMSGQLFSPASPGLMLSPDQRRSSHHRVRYQSDVKNKNSPITSIRGSGGSIRTSKVIKYTQISCGSVPQIALHMSRAIDSVPVSVGREAMQKVDDKLTYLNKTPSVFITGLLEDAVIDRSRINKNKGLSLLRKIVGACSPKAFQNWLQKYKVDSKGFRSSSRHTVSTPTATPTATAAATVVPVTIEIGLLASLLGELASVLGQLGGEAGGKRGDLYHLIRLIIILGDEEGRVIVLGRLLGLAEEEWFRSSLSHGERMIWLASYCRYILLQEATKHLCDSREALRNLLSLHILPDQTVSSDTLKKAFTPLGMSLKTEDGLAICKYVTWDSVADKAPLRAFEDWLCDTMPISFRILQFSVQSLFQSTPGSLNDLMALCGYKPNSKSENTAAITPDLTRKGSRTKSPLKGASVNASLLSPERKKNQTSSSLLPNISMSMSMSMEALTSHWTSPTISDVEFCTAVRALDSFPLSHSDAYLLARLLVRGGEVEQSSSSQQYLSSSPFDQTNEGGGGGGGGGEGIRKEALSVDVRLLLQITNGTFLNAALK